MELFMLTALQLLMAVQSYNTPNIKVSPDVVRESNSVFLTCETPADVTVIQCHFYAKDKKKIKHSQSCDLNLTGAEVLLWTGKKSPVSLNIVCYYVTNVGGVPQSSPHSHPVTLTVLDTLKKPTISVDDSTAQLSVSCEIHLSVRADFICTLHTEAGLHWTSDSKRTQSGQHHCVFYPSLSDIFKQKQTENTEQMSCDYSPKMVPDLRSPRSELYTIRGIPQAKLTVSSSVIMERETVRLICGNTVHQKMDTCYFTVNGIESNIKQSRSCELSLTGSDIINWSGGQRSSVIITCYYTVEQLQTHMPSPHSGPVTVTIQTSTQAATARATTTVMKTSSTQAATARATTTAMKTFSTQAATARATTTVMKTSVAVSSTTVPTSHPTADGGQTFKIPLAAFTGVGAFISILIGFCLCRFAYKKRTKSQVTAGGTTGSGRDGIYSLITSVPDTSQPTGLTHPQSHQDSKPGSSEIYSLITLTFQRSDALVNTQHKDGPNEENKNEYQIYCTIPDKPVNAGNEIYSLAC